MAEELKVGDKIPPFFLKDHEGYDVADEDVIGSPIVLYFYSKDDTPSCTEEACSLRDSMDQFDARQVLIIGVSPDPVKAHKNFIQKHSLEFSLLSDEKKDMARMYGALNEKDEVIRTTFLIDSRGIVRWMEKPVTVKGHVERILAALDKHCKDEVIKFDDFQQDYEDFLQKNLKTDEDRKKIEKEMRKKFGIKKRDLGDKKE